MSRVSIHMTAKDARHVLWLIQGLVGAETTRARAAIERALRPKRSVKLAHARVAKKKATRKEKVSSIRAAVVARSDWACEACGVRLALFEDALQLDHFRGGAHKRSNESVEGCWALCDGCHRKKTDNKPSRVDWLSRFREHCLRHGYTREARETERLIDAAHLSAASAGRVSPSLEETNR